MLDDAREGRREEEGRMGETEGERAREGRMLDDAREGEREREGRMCVREGARESEGRMLGGGVCLIECGIMRQHTSAHVSIRQRTSAYV